MIHTTKSYVILTVAYLCLIAGIVSMLHHVNNSESQTLRTRTQQTEQLDRIEAKVTTILYEQSKREYEATAN